MNVEKKNRFKSYLFSISKLILTIVFFAIIFYKSNISELIILVKKIDVRIFLFSIILSFVSYYINSIKIKFLFPNSKIIRNYLINLISFSFGSMLFGQIGAETLKVFYFNKNEKNLNKVISIILFDRLTSLLGLLIISCIALIISNRIVPSNISYAAIILLAINLHITAIISSGKFFTYLLNFLEYAKKYFPKIVYDEISRKIPSDETVKYFKNKSNVYALTSLGAIVHLTNVYQVYIIGLELKIDIQYLDWCWIVGLMSVANLIPLPIGQIPSFGTLIMSLQNLGVDYTTSGILCAFLLVINFITACVGGFAGLFLHNKI